MITKIVLGIEYDGSSYCGWQRQSGLPSIQESLEKALSRVASEKIIIVCAGRTDSKVHAIEQVVHFETKVFRSNSAWVLGTNSYLPSSIIVLWSIVVDSGFHARFNALSRRYCYIIYNNNTRSAIFHKKVTNYQKSLNIDIMMQAAQCLLGENDFTSFRSVHCQSRSSCRNLYHINMFRNKKYVIIDIAANAFMHHMVRKIVGSLMMVGCGYKPINWIFEVLVKRDRLLLNRFIAPPDGLYLLSVQYSSIFNLPLKDVVVPFL